MKFFPWQIFRSINKKNQNQNKSLRPKFHFSTPKGWCNDPNGFSQFGDKIHLFFQHHPYSTQWGPMHWGHVVTSDMLTWEQLPIALSPDTTADCKGCFSGTALEKDGHFEALPRLTLSFNDYLTLAAYRTFTLPTFNQLYYPMAGNPELVPEQGWTCTVSYNDKRFPVYGRFTYSYYENKIRWGFGPVAMNVGNADYYVAALGYEQSFWDNHINIQADGTMTQARLRDTHKQIMWVPEWQIHANAGFSYNDFTALVDYSWTSGLNIMILITFQAESGQLD